jgi:hypothetical protein
MGPAPLSYLGSRRRIFSAAGKWIAPIFDRGPVGRAAENKYRCPVTPGVVDRDAGIQQADDGMRHGGHTRAWLLPRDIVIISWLRRISSRARFAV